MFRLDYTSPSEVAGTIRVKKPIWSLGRCTDIDGNRWDVRAIFHGEDGMYVCAVPENELHPYYSDTSGRSFGFVQQTWLPYKVEVVT